VIPAEKAWVGVDVGKTHHWVCVLDTDGKKMLSMKIANDQAEISAVITRVSELARQIIWAIDIVGAPSALLLALLCQAGQSVRYASGRVVATMSTAYTGEGKTDAKDAYIIAETARLRRDLTIIDHSTDLIRNLGLLTAHRADLIADRVRMINRLRDVMTSVFLALEREFDYSSSKGALVLLTGYASPERLRHVGVTRLAGWLRARRVRGYADLAARAVSAARSQQIVLCGQDIAASIIAELATNVLALDQRVKDLDTQIAATFDQHPAVHPHHRTVLDLMKPQAKQAVTEMLACVLRIRRTPHRRGQDETRDNPLPQTTTRTRDLDTYASAAYHPRTRQAHRLTDIGASTPSPSRCSGCSRTRHSQPDRPSAPARYAPSPTSRRSPPTTSTGTTTTACTACSTTPHPKSSNSPTTLTKPAHQPATPPTRRRHESQDGSHSERTTLLRP
jgi:hypothetical protein